MKTADIIKAWRNEERAAPGAQQLQELPQNSGGEFELSESECALVAGGGYSYIYGAVGSLVKGP